MSETSKSYWQEVLSEIRAWEKPLKEEGFPVWYRGQADSAWPLRSSLHRHIVHCYETVQARPIESVELLREIYSTLYFKFKARAWRFLEPVERSPWGIIFAMQHYGLPTMLLDWTESFACALYFANQNRQPQTTAVIYLLNPQRLTYESLNSLGEYYRQNQIEGEVMAPIEGLLPLGETLDEARFSSYFHPEHRKFRRIRPEACRTIAVAPFFSNPRMLAQRAAFTLSGSSFSPLDEQFGDNVIKKFELPPETDVDAHEFLNLVGIGHFGYFPDIPNLVRDLKDELNRELEMAIKFRGE